MTFKIKTKPLDNGDKGKQAMTFKPGDKIKIKPLDNGAPRAFDASQIRGESTAEKPVGGVVLTTASKAGTHRVALDDPFGWTELPGDALEAAE